MKTTFSVFLACLFFLFVQIGNGCAQCREVVDIREFVFVDVTDKEHLDLFREHVAVEYNHLLRYFVAKGAFTACRRGVFSISGIDDKGENRPVTVTSAVIDPNMTKTQIDRQIKAGFYEGVKAGLKKILESESGNLPERKKTRIYEPLCLLLKESAKTRKPLDLVVYSDLLEHHSVSFYTAGKAIPVEATLKKLESSCNCILPEDLSFLRLHLISFRTAENDRLVGAARAFWVSVFTNRKAIVNTGTGLQAGFFSFGK